MTNKTISMASKKTVALLVAAASLGTGAIAGSAAYAATNTGTAATKNEDKGDKLVDGVAPTRDYAASEDGRFTASTGEVDKHDLTDWVGDTAYKPGVADAYWLQVDLGKARDISSVSIAFLQNANVDGFVQYTNDAEAAKDPASKAWTDFSKLDGASGTFNAKAGKVVKARFIRVFVNKTAVNPGAPTGTKAEDVAGVKDFQVNAATVFADNITTDDSIKNVHETHIGDVYNFTTKTTPADADVEWDVDAPEAFDVQHGETDKNGVTKWTLTVKHSTAGVDMPVTIRNLTVPASKDGKQVDAKTVLHQNFSSWDYAGSITASAFEGNEQLFIGDTANGGKGAQIAAAITGKNGEAAKQEFDVSTDTDALATTVEPVTGKDGKKTENLYVKGVKVGNGKVILKAKDTAPVKDDKGKVTGHETVDSSLNFVSNYHSATGFVDGSIKAPSEITLGDKGTYKVEAKVAPAETANQAVTFKSSDEKTLTVGADGTLTPHVEGLGDTDAKNVTVTITAPGVVPGEDAKTTTVEVTVKRPAVQSITLDSGLKDNTITLGDATEKGLAVKATVSPEFANTELTWASSNGKVATVDNAGNVKFTGQPGSVVITASSNHGVGGDKAPVVGSTLIDVVRPKVTSLTAYRAGDAAMTPVTELTHVLGQDNAPVDLDVAASPKYADDSVYWLTGDAAIADVDAKTGVVTFHGTEGSTTVTAVSVVDGTVQARVNVKNVAPAPTGIAVSTPEGFDAANVKVGDKFQLTAAITPALAHQDVKWASSDEKVATVDANGNVTVLAAGKARITATSVADAKLSDGVDIVATKAAEPTEPGTKPETKPDTKPEVKPETKPEVKPDTKPETKPEVDAFAKVKATYTDLDGQTVDVPNFDGTKDGTYKLPLGVSLDKVELTTDGLETTVKYTAAGKPVNVASKADTAVYTVKDGETTHVYTFEKTIVTDNEATKPGKDDDLDGLFSTGDKDSGTDNKDKKPAADKQADNGGQKTAAANGDLAHTGAAVGIVAAVSAALAGAGVTLRKVSKRD